MPPNALSFPIAWRAVASRSFFLPASSIAGVQATMRPCPCRSSARTARRYGSWGRAFPTATSWCIRIFDRLCLFDLDRIHAADGNKSIPDQTRSAIALSLAAPGCDLRSRDFWKKARGCAAAPLVQGEGPWLGRWETTGQRSNRSWPFWFPAPASRDSCPGAPSVLEPLHSRAYAAAATSLLSKAGLRGKGKAKQKAALADEQARPLHV